MHRDSCSLKKAEDTLTDFISFKRNQNAAKKKNYKHLKNKTVLTDQLEFNFRS